MKLILFGEPLRNINELADKLGEPKINLNHAFKAIVIENQTHHHGIAFHHGGLGGRMVFKRDENVSFENEKINESATAWWQNSFN